jgi:hypothetical protein
VRRGDRQILGRKRTTGGTVGRRTDTAKLEATRQRLIDEGVKVRGGVDHDS